MPIPTPIDVVYTLGTKSNWQDNELRFSLRSVERFLLPLGTVWIVGHLPSWCTNVRHIPFPDENIDNIDANLINKIRRVAQEPQLAENFLFFNDDIYLLSPVGIDDIKYFHLGDLANNPDRAKLNEPQFVEAIYQNPDGIASIKWQERLWNTYDVLKALNQPTYNLDGHVPYRYRKSLVEPTISKCDYLSGHGCTINTLFLNHQLLYEDAFAKLTDVQTVRAGVYSPITSLQLQQMLLGKKFFNHDEPGLCPAVIHFLQHNFTAPSKFEKQTL